MPLNHGAGPRAARALGGAGAAWPPLVVNTQGWVRGLGVPLLADLLRHTCPRVVLQLQSAAPGRNLPAALWPLPPDTLAVPPQGAPGPAAALPAAAAAAWRAHGPQHLLVVPSANPADDGRAPPRFPPRALRELALLVWTGGGPCSQARSLAPSLSDPVLWAGGRRRCCRRTWRRRATTRPRRRWRCPGRRWP